jgi:hypothetical protein
MSEYLFFPLLKSNPFTVWEQNYELHVTTMYKYMGLREIKQQEHRVLCTSKEGIHNSYCSPHIVKVTLLRMANLTNHMLKWIRYMTMAKATIMFMGIVMMIVFINYL